MCSRTVELLIKGSVFMQHAIEDIGRNSSCHKAGRVGWQGKSLRRHEGKSLNSSGKQERESGETESGLAREYAKCKNPWYAHSRLYDFTASFRDLEWLWYWDERADPEQELSTWPRTSSLT